MAEVAVSGENHRHAACVRSVDNFLVAHGAARLNCRRCAGVRRSEQAVGKREERVARDNGAFKREPRFARLPHGDAGRIDARHLPGTILMWENRRNCFLSFLDTEALKDDKGYQLWQALTGFANGRLYGEGLGNGMIYRGFLPEAHTDCVFAVIGEELGFCGTVFIPLLFLTLFGIILAQLRNWPASVLPRPSEF